MNPASKFMMSKVLRVVGRVTVVSVHGFLMYRLIDFVTEATSGYYINETVIVT